MTITDDDLTRALASAADAIEVPEWEGLDTPVDISVWRRSSTRWVAGSAAGVAAIVGLFAIASTTPSADRNTSASSGVKRSASQPQAGLHGDIGTLQPAAATAGGDALTNYSGGAGVAGGTTGGGAIAPATPTDTSRVVKTGSISLVVDDGKVPATMIKLRQVAASARGFLAEEKTQGVGSDPSGVATMRVPVASFDAVVAQISGKGFGAKVTGVESSGKDVSAEYADTAAQITSLKAAHSRYLTILNGADTIGEILSVQQRVDDVQKQIDRLEGSRRLLANQSDLATLTVSVNQKASQVLVSSERSGWSKAWHDSTHGFTSGIQSIVAHSGRALLVLLVGIACIALGRGSWRIARRRLI